jgi:hypothetical protein
LRGDGGGRRDREVGGEIHIYIDGKEVTNTVIRGVQKTGKRRTSRRAGATAGRSSVF